MFLVTIDLFSIFFLLNNYTFDKQKMDTIINNWKIKKKQEKVTATDTPLQ